MRATSLETRATGGGKVKRERARCRVLLRGVYAGRVQRGRGQGDRGPRTQGPGKVGEGGREGTNTRGAGLGQRTGVEGGSKEGGLPRELLRPVLARAERATREAGACSALGEQRGRGREQRGQGRG